MRIARLRISNEARRPAFATLLRYGLAFASVAAAVGLSLVLIHSGLPRLFGVFSLAAIAIAFWFGGTGPGLLAVLLSSLAFSFLLFPVTEVRGPGWESFLAIYAMFGGLVGWFSASRHRAERLLAEARGNLEKRVAERTRELAQAEQELRRSQEHLRLVTDTVPALIHTGRPDGYLDYFNQRWLNFIGLPLDALAGWKWTTAFHPEDIGATVEKWHAALATGEPFIHEARLRRADGEYRWMFLRKVPLRDEEGKILKWYGTAIDIEDRKRVEEDLRKSEERWRAVFDNSAVGIALTEPGGKYLRSNRAYQEMVGYTDEELRGLSYMDITYDDDREINRALVAELVEGKRQQFSVEKRYWRKNGDLIWVRVTVSEAHDTDGKFQFAMAVVEDITERKRAEQALRESEEHHRSVVQTASDAVISVDKNGQIIFANQATTRVFGYTPDEMIGMPLASLMPEFLRQSHTTGFERYLKTGERTLDWRRVEFVGLRKTGEQFPVEISFGEFANHGQHTFTGFLRDITERNRAEGALRASEERWRSVFENSAIGVALTDVNGRFLATNPVFQKIVGYSEEELRKLSFIEVTLEEYREANWALIGELLEGKRQEFQIEKQYRRKDGSLIWVLNSVSLVPGTESVPRFVLALSEDITERKIAEKALRRSEAYLEAGQRLSHTGSWALELSSGGLFWSEETYRVFGFDPASTTPSVQDTFLPRIHPEDRPRVERGLKAAAIQKEYYAFDYRIVLPNGLTKYIHDVVYPVIGESGEVVERYGVIMDVTERKRAELALQRSRDQLRALAVRLQHVREEERTRVAREIHDELGQALTAIKIDLSSLSHDMPTEMKRRCEAVMKLADETIHSVRRISTELRPAVLDTLGLVAAVEWAAEEFEARTGTQCRLDLPPDEVFIDHDTATALFRIFQETLTNVARHANATEVNVRLAWEDGNLTLEVHDNGQGIGEEQLSAANSLGILGMRERALLLGGELTITGAAGRGTTVIARIPETRRALAKEDV